MTDNLNTITLPTDEELANATFADEGVETEVAVFQAEEDVSPDAA